MAEWLSYSISDLLLFSLPAYTGLFQLSNTTLWPVHLLTLALGLAIGALILKPGRTGDRIVWAVLGLVWIWSGWHFLYVQYATINWAAAYVAPVFWLQGLLFGVSALVPKCPEIRYAPTTAGWTAGALYLFALLGYPAVTVALGRPVDSTEFFGISADPGGVATLAILILGRGSLIRLAWIVPLAWCATTGATLWLLGSPEFFIAPMAAVTALLAAILNRNTPRSLPDS